MSLWRVRHGLSPVFEAALITLAAGTGVLAIWLATVRPFAYPATIAIRSIAGPIPLDTDSWSRSRNVVYGYEYGVPPGWVMDDSDPSRVALARNLLALTAPLGARVTVEVRPLAERQDASNVAAEEFAGHSPALYDVGVAGHPGLFAIAFVNGRVGSQAVYVQRGENVVVIHGDGMNPAAFSAFISTIRFFTP